uniref:Uncharacterized protein n=1 Tax=Anguilla anguilla TaxID=7936 RepID=A0A0E9TAC3_ANGAN
MQLCRTEILTEILGKFIYNNRQSVHALFHSFPPSSKK